MFWWIFLNPIFFRVATGCSQGSALSAFLWIVLIDSVLILLAMQILAGVAPLNDYFLKLKISHTPLCQCGSPETILHFLFDYHNYAQQRISFRNTVISNNKQWPPLLSIITQSKPIFNAMISSKSSIKRSHHNPIT